MWPTTVGKEISVILSNFIFMVESKVALFEFKCEVLNAMNVVPSQLHSNTWGFMHAFEILCKYLKIV